MCTLDVGVFKAASMYIQTGRRGSKRRGAGRKTAARGQPRGYATQGGGPRSGETHGGCLASTEIKNIDSHSHAGLHRGSIRFSPGRQYLFFPRTVRGTNCSCISRSFSLSLSLSLSLSFALFPLGPSTLAAQESQTQRLFFIWFFLSPYSPQQPLPLPPYTHTHTRIHALIPPPHPTHRRHANQRFFLSSCLFLLSSSFLCARARACV